MFISVHSDVSRESYSFELFDLPLDVGNKPGIQGFICIPVDSFDLRYESVTTFQPIRVPFGLGVLIFYMTPKINH